MNGRRDYTVYLQDMLDFATKGIDFVKGFNLQVEFPAALRRHSRMLLEGIYSNTHGHKAILRGKSLTCVLVAELKFRFTSCPFVKKPSWFFVKAFFVTRSYTKKDRSCTKNELCNTLLRKVSNKII